jgi:hypothetical protein
VKLRRTAATAAETSGQLDDNTAAEDAAAVRATKRLRFIEAIERERSSTVLTYVMSTRPFAEAIMGPDAIPVIYKHLRALDLDRKSSRLDLLLHTNGGETTVPWHLMSLLREFACEVNVLIAHHAYSAGTLTALGADHVIMHPMGILGPTDPTVMSVFNPRDDDGQPIPIEAEDVTSFHEFAKQFALLLTPDQNLGKAGRWRRLTHSVSTMRSRYAALLTLTEHLHPLTLGAIRRSAAQSTLMGDKLLKARAASAPALDQDVVNRLTSTLFDHRHAISRREAIDALGLRHVFAANDALEPLMWQLYEEYEAEMRLEDEYDATREALRELGGVLPPPPPLRPDGESDVSTTSVNVVVKSVFIESRARSDCRQLDIDVTIARDSLGDLDAYAVTTEDRWRKQQRAESPPKAGD